MSLLMTVAGIGSVLAYTIAAEIGDISRFASPRKLAGYSGLCPRVYQSGESDRRGPLAKHGRRYLRWALVEAATHPSRHPVYCHRYQRTKNRLGKAPRSPRSPRSTSPAGSPKRSGTCSPATNPSLRQAPPTPWPPDGPVRRCATGANLPSSLILPPGGDREMSTARHPHRPHPP
jgi:Transposase IS116/IS110/IS902 family